MKNKETKTQEIYRLANKLGLQENEIDLIVNKNSGNEQVYLSAGPSWYPGAHYGSISIYDF